MGKAGQHIVSVSIASGASSSGSADLGSYFNNVYVYVSTMSTAAAITVQDSPDAGTTFYNKFIYANSATTQANQIVIASGVGTNGGMLDLDAGCRYLRFLASAVVSGGVQFKVVGYD